MDDSFEQTLRKSKEAGQRLKQALSKSTGEKTVQKTEQLIESTESKLQQSKQNVAQTQKFFNKIQQIFGQSVENAVQSVEAAVAPPQIEPGFIPHRISAQNLAQILKNSKKITFLTGSGLCEGLGLPEYRSHGFNKESAEYDLQNEDEEKMDQAILITKFCFNLNSKKGWKWVSSYVQAIEKAEPTPAHFLIDDIVQQLGRQGTKVTLVTENIDNYHQDVQKLRKVNIQTYPYSIIPINGNILQIRCGHCSYQKEIPYLESYQAYAFILTTTSRLFCPVCEGPLHPNIMLHDQFYNELFNKSETFLGLADESDLIVVIGSTNESPLTKQAIQNALTLGKKVVQIGAECRIGKKNMFWLQKPANQVLQQVKNHLNS